MTDLLTRPGRLQALATFLAVSLAALAPAAASAACVTSAPGGQGYADNPSDSEAGLAPEISQTNVATDGNCGLTVSFTITNQPAMGQNDFLAWFIDSDGNAGTGSQSGFRGADHSVGRLDSGFTGLSRYNPGTGQFEFVRQVSPSGPFGAFFSLNDIAAVNGAVGTVAGGASWEGTYDTYYDWAPEPGQAPYPFTWAFSDSAPPPPPPPPAPPAPPAPAPQSPAAPSDLADDGCRVPSLRGMTIARAANRLGARGCSLGRVRRVRSTPRNRGRVISSSPRAGTRRPRGTRVNLVVGKGPRRARRASSLEAERLERELNALTER
ncbi:MAG TPA: PASTA domain-containing protein [Thermoleophilaceae bacterium]|nr:PASTA domain-containing protein [Thermoleophilaceae bacterium]